MNNVPNVAFPTFADLDMVSPQLINATGQVSSVSSYVDLEAVYLVSALRPAWFELSPKKTRKNADMDHTGTSHGVGVCCTEVCGVIHPYQPGNRAKETPVSRGFPFYASERASQPPTCP